METVFIASALSLSEREREAFRAAAANLALSLPGGASVAFTSCLENNGRSRAALALAAALAGAGRRVTLVDGDLRTGTLSALLGAHSAPGLSEMLSEKTAEAPLLPAELPTLRFLPAGKTVSDPSALLSSDTLSEALGALSGQSDFVIVDTPAVLSTADGSLIAAAASNSILYAVKGCVKRLDLASAKLQLEKSGRPTVGMLVGAAPARKHSLSALLARLPFLGKKQK